MQEYDCWWILKNMFIIIFFLKFFLLCNVEFTHFWNRNFSYFSSCLFFKLTMLNFKTNMLCKIIFQVTFHLSNNLKSFYASQSRKKSVSTSNCKGKKQSHTGTADFGFSTPFTANSFPLKGSSFYISREYWHGDLKRLKNKSHSSLKLIYRKSKVCHKIAEFEILK